MPYLVSIIGPTATGKTALSIRLAKRFNTAILSFDSRQCYKEISIGVCKPSLDERQGIDHYFIDSHSIWNAVTVKTFKDYAEETLKSLFLTHDIVIAVGGTGLFWHTLLYGIDEMPSIDGSIRARIQSEYEKNGIEWLQKTIAEEDPLYFSYGEMKNPQRMMRALEVKRGTGASITLFQRRSPAPNPLFSSIAIGLRYTRKEDYRRGIAERVYRMERMGLEEEARSIYPYKQSNAFKTVGYKEWAPYFEGRDTKENALQAIIKNTNDYAKRQMTWFRRYADIYWAEQDVDIGTIVEHIYQHKK